VPHQPETGGRGERSNVNEDWRNRSDRVGPEPGRREEKSAVLMLMPSLAVGDQKGGERKALSKASDVLCHYNETSDVGKSETRGGARESDS